MRKSLIPFDGSDNALRAVQYVISLAEELPGLQVELLYVMDPVPFKLYAGLSDEGIRRMQVDEADRVVQPARQLLDAAKIPYRAHFRIGPPANEIALHLHEMHCDGIVMGTRGMSPMAALMIGSVATRTIHLVDVPVTLVK